MFSVIFPGQGSQIVGMGKDLHLKYNIIKRLFKEADEILGFSISNIILEGPKEKLDLTENTQPAIFLLGYSIFNLLKKENFIDLNKAKFFAGHSLGEYTALASAEVLSFSETLNLSGSGTILSAAVENSKVVTKNTLSLSNNTGQASNYTLDGGTHSFNVTKRPITLATSRIYDGTNVLDGTSVSTTFTYSNIVGSEVLSQTGTGTVSSANVGSGKAVTVVNLTLVDGSGAANNYNLT